MSESSEAAKFQVPTSKSYVRSSKTGQFARKVWSGTSVAISIRATNSLFQLPRAVPPAMYSAVSPWLFHTLYNQYIQPSSSPPYPIVPHRPNSFPRQHALYHAVNQITDNKKFKNTVRRVHLTPSNLSAAFPHAPACSMPAAQRRHTNATR